MSCRVVSLLCLAKGVSTAADVDPNHAFELFSGQRSAPVIVVGENMGIIQGVKYHT